MTPHPLHKAFFPIAILFFLSGAVYLVSLPPLPSETHTFYVNYVYCRELSSLTFRSTITSFVLVREACCIKKKSRVGRFGHVLLMLNRWWQRPTLLFSYCPPTMVSLIKHMTRNRKTSLCSMIMVKKSSPEHQKHNQT